jgi:hypothetical protein
MANSSLEKNFGVRSLANPHGAPTAAAAATVT